MSFIVLGPQHNLIKVIRIKLSFSISDITKDQLLKFTIHTLLLVKILRKTLILHIKPLINH